MIYLKALVFKLDMVILFQFMKILKKRMEKKNHEKQQRFFQWSNHLKMSYCTSLFINIS